MFDIKMRDHLPGKSDFLIGMTKGEREMSSPLIEHFTLANPASEVFSAIPMDDCAIVSDKDHSENQTMSGRAQARVGFRH